MINGQQPSEDNILIGFQLNTVVNSHNWMEDMVFEVDQLSPVRWKVIEINLRTRIITTIMIISWDE